MGGNVHEVFGKSVYTVGFAAHGGRAGTRFSAKPFALSPPQAGSVEDLLHRYGEPFLFVDLRRDGPFGKPMPMAPMSYDRSMQARWPDVLDAVFFIDEMTPAR
jgi:erythromycin esterase-like protein